MVILVGEVLISALKLYVAGVAAQRTGRADPLQTTADGL